MSSTTWESRPELPDGAPPPRPAAGPQAWNPWAAPIALVASLLIALFGGTLIAGIAAAFGASIEDTPPGVLLGGTIVQDLAFIAVPIVLARMAGPTWAGQFGLRVPRPLRALGVMAAVYLGYLLLSGLWQQVVRVEEDQELLEDLGVKDSTAALVAALVTVCVIAPLAEEFLFRGFFFGALRNWRFGVWPAALVTGVVFGGIHAASSPAEALVPLAILGVGLCVLYERTGSLLPCIALHGINNSIAFGVLQDWTWQIPLLVAGSLAACALAAGLVMARWRPPLPPSGAAAPA